MPHALRVPLAAALPDPTWLSEDATSFSPGLFLPIRLLEGRELDAVIADVMRQIDFVATVLQANPVSAPTTEPPVALAV